ncbi:hypothetical protein FH972_023129 [Carpinus fangiana]|uniref:E3 ubiquitin-protein ligase n=1 Tax=Carpinus fangiana TaxID=176857 RepID=A0A5N6KUW0_9ROSI|nr:hypothetical protein FH972_023129 [Carpinus fangiana]
MEKEDDDDRWLCGQLRTLAFEHERRWSEEASAALTRILFTSLANKNQDYVSLFFPGGEERAEQAHWKLAEAQGAQDGAEYTEAARGKRCGHIFKNGEATYGCKTCGVDVTCVLCAKCFEASDHEGHQITVNTSMGSSGCCDCGDEEAWARPVNCSIHTPYTEREQKEKGKTRTPRPIPQDLQESIRVTISRAFDFICDIFSCAANERMRNLQGEKAVRDNEIFSRLKGQQYRGTDDTEKDDEFCLVLWNDEKHTLDEVMNNVAKALKAKKSYGLAKAREVDDVGRSMIHYSRDVDELLKKAQMLERIKVTVTIRSARDTFREMMCGTIVDWLNDIAGCAVGDDHSFLMNTVCEEMLKPWRMGSGAVNLEVGKGGINDQAADEDRLVKQRRTRERRMFNFLRAGGNIAGGAGLGPVTMTTAGTVAIAIAPAILQPAIDAAEDDQSGSDDEDNEDFTIDMEDEFGNVIMEAGNTDPMDLENSDDDGADEGDDYVANLEATMDELLERRATEDAAWGVGPMTPGSTLSRSQTGASDDGSEGEATAQSNPERLITQIPRRHRAKPQENVIAPPYWSKVDIEWKPPKGENSDDRRPVYENLTRRVRVDFMILYDLRMWKQLRNDLRNLYIRTVITVPYFKRVLGLRFASVYTYLAQLYLIADREPDHSIINLSLQMLTTPSITNEAIDRGNFLTKLLAILYTFLTKRQVDHPHNVDLNATMSLDAQITSNRRVYHFFNDMKYLLDSKHVQEQIRLHDEYLQQCIDFVKLYQGICPHVRVLGEHVEYESDLWITASIIGRDIAKMTRHFCEAFAWSRNTEASYICRALRQAAKATIINSMGAERHRFKEADFKRETRFERVDPYAFDREHDSANQHLQKTYEVVQFVVEEEPMSFYHTLHFMLSWLIDCGKSMSKDQLKLLLTLDRRQLQMPGRRSPFKATVPEGTDEQYLLALFDVPLRVCAWLAQMRAGMWVRNGMHLRHQVSTARNVGTRDNSHQRDIFLLQVALAVLPADTFLVSMACRFGMLGLLNGDLTLKVGWQDDQYMDVAEEFIHLLIVLFSDRTLLLPPEEEPNAQELSAKKDIAHALCFKPLSHSELVNRLSERVTQEMDSFPDLVRQMANYRAPEGLQDTGTFELKLEHYDEIDPYNAWYSKNQREEAESIWRQKKAKQLQKPVEEIAFEPRPRPIRTGVFAGLGSSMQNCIFGKIIWNALSLFTGNAGELRDLPTSRFETFLHPVLHLTLLAIAEDRHLTQPDTSNVSSSFLDFAILCKFRQRATEAEEPILALLLKILQLDEYDGMRAKIRLVLRRMREKRSHIFDEACKEVCSQFRLGDPAEVLKGTGRNDSSQDLAEKKRKALERNARVMAGMKAQQKEFEQNQTIDWGFDPDEVDSDEDMTTDEPSKRTWHYPEGTCIFCQEDTNDQKLYGTLTFICESSLFRETDLEDRDYISEATSSPQNLDHSADAIRPYGVAGQNVQQVQKVKSDGSINIQEIRGLGKGFPSKSHEKGTIATGCGHLMHYSCFETYLSATARRQNQQIARDHPERRENKEFICPLCKALGNAFFPVVWRPKELLGPREPQTKSFEDFVTNTVPLLMSTGAEYPQYQMIHQHYAAEAFVSSLAAKVSEMGKVGASSSNRATSPHTGGMQSANVLGPLFQMPGFLSAARQPEAPSRDVANDSTGSLVQSIALTELLRAYSRLNETIRNNSLTSRKIWPPLALATSQEHLVNSDVLASSLGFSIASVEIAQRGVATPGPTFLAAISDNILTQLRIQSETASSYIAIGGLHNPTLGMPKLQNEPKEASIHQIYQLFGFSPDLSVEQVSGTDPLFIKDTFVFLAECSVFMIPHLHLDINDILKLCYLAEIVKVIVAYLQTPTAAWNYARQDLSSRTTQSGAQEEVAKSKCSPAEGRSFSNFVQQIWEQVRSVLRPTDRKYLDNPNERFRFDHFLRAAVQSYILPFLRKSILLMHVRYGTDYSSIDADDPKLPEVARLTKMLGLPSVDQLIASFDTPSATTSHLYRMMQHWMTHSLGRHVYLQDRQTTDGVIPLLPRRFLRIQLPHPAIFELVALPQNYDQLNTEAMSHRCPNSGKDLVDASVCLFCGEVFCGQAQCCSIAPRPDSEERYGGCMQHQNKCAGNIGMFINIRKCTALLNNEKQGSFLQAPYLDEHGETDMGLRRRNQLFLNRKRYDKLFRDVWLNHGVPSAISRKLEADVNTGGWETI